TSPPSRTAPTPSWSGDTTSSISPLMEKCLRTHSPSPPSPPRTTPLTQPPGCLRPTDGDPTSTSGAPGSPNSSTYPVRHRGGHLGSPVRRRHNPPPPALQQAGVDCRGESGREHGAPAL